MTFSLMWTTSSIVSDKNPLDRIASPTNSMICWNNHQSCMNQMLCSCDLLYWWVRYIYKIFGFTVPGLGLKMYSVRWWPCFFSLNALSQHIPLPGPFLVFQLYESVTFFCCCHKYDCNDSVIWHIKYYIPQKGSTISIYLLRWMVILLHVLVICIDGHLCRKSSHQHPIFSHQQIWQ